MRLYVIKRARGYVLVIVMVFLHVMALFSLYALESSWVENKIGINTLNKQLTLHKLEYILQQIEQKLQNQLPNCSITPHERDLASKPLSWWQQQSCTGNFQSIQYYYVVESLGVDPCAIIPSSGGFSADYYRLTLLGLHHEKRYRMMMQSTIIKAVIAEYHCQASEHPVRIGRQSLIGG